MRASFGGLNHVLQYPVRPCRNVVTSTSTRNLGLVAPTRYQSVCLPLGPARLRCVTAEYRYCATAVILACGAVRTRTPTVV